MNITKNNYKELEKIIKQKLFNKSYEFEARICGLNSNKKMTNINLNQLSYENILKYLIYPKEKNGLNLNVVKKTYLDILIKNSDIRITLNNKDDIKKYWLTGSLEDTDYSIIKKNNIYNYNLDNYSIKFSLSSETNITAEKFNTNNVNSKEKILNISL